MTHSSKQQVHGEFWEKFWENARGCRGSRKGGWGNVATTTTTKKASVKSFNLLLPFRKRMYKVHSYVRLDFSWKRSRTPPWKSQRQVRGAGPDIEALGSHLGFHS